VIVHQLLSGAGPHDAVTRQALAYRELFDRWGWGGLDFAAAIDPRVNGVPTHPVRLLERLQPGRDDVLLFHYSAYAPRLRDALALPQRKLLVSHNITPARWLWAYDPGSAVQCAVGRSQLPHFARAVDLATGVSAYNAAELEAAGARETDVLPILFDRSKLGLPTPPGPAARGDGPPTVLFVGRVTPHKRQDEVIRAFALYRRLHAPDARLVLVGSPQPRGFDDDLRGLASQLAPGAVTIEADVTPEGLWERYRRADAFLCLSEHEGFCIPLLEAFHFGVPVVARPVGGVPEVAGDAALLVEDRDPAVIAELLALAIGDDALRAELRARGERRLEDYASDRTAERIRSAVERVARTSP
jgi:glycosyltransferase involved in cell wall biosynthesis